MVVHNEAHRLAPMLAWHRAIVDDIAIVVQASDDATLRIARDWADTVIKHPCYGYCEASREAASRAARYDRQLILDADEWLAAPFVRAVRERAAALGDGILGLRLRRRFWLDGVCEFAGDAQHRLVWRPNVVFLDEIHTEPQSSVGWGSVPTWGDPEMRIAIEHIKTTREQLADEERCHALLSDGGALAHDPLRAQKLALNVHRGAQ